jgi:hypothetical protein
MQGLKMEVSYVSLAFIITCVNGAPSLIKVKKGILKYYGHVSIFGFGFGFGFYFLFFKP